MRSITIDKTEDGIKLHKYLKNIFKEMPNSLLQKLLRKKYFEINGKVADGSEILTVNDVLTIYLGDETFDKFFTSKVNTDSNEGNKNKCDTKCQISYEEIISHIVYEDDNLIVFNKWAGLLSQGDKSSDVSVNSLLNSYLAKQYENKEDNKHNNKVALYNFKPSVVNRLDRNTEGLILFAKSYIFAREISKVISDNKIDKHYKTIVNGIIENDEYTLVNLYKKDKKNNIAIIKDIDKNTENENLSDGFSIVKLKHKVIDRNDDSTILDIKLITGKSHQIRAQLSHIGHPIICDKKYMDISLYNDNAKRYKRNSQVLVCYKMQFPHFENENLEYLSNKVFEIKDELNKYFYK